MTWAIKFEVKNGAACGLKVTGTPPPDGTVIVTGYDTDHGRMLGVQAGDFTVTTYAPNRVAVPAGGTVVDAGQLARAAYAAYGDRTGGKNHQGEPMPAWEDLGDTIREAWTGATVAVMNKVHEQEET